MRFRKCGIGSEPTERNHGQEPQTNSGNAEPCEKRLAASEPFQGFIVALGEGPFDADADRQMPEESNQHAHGCSQGAESENHVAGGGVRIAADHCPCGGSERKGSKRGDTRVGPVFAIAQELQKRTLPLHGNLADFLEVKSAARPENGEQNVQRTDNSDGFDHGFSFAGRRKRFALECRNFPLIYTNVVYIMRMYVHVPSSALNEVNETHQLSYVLYVPTQGSESGTGGGATGSRTISPVVRPSAPPPAEAESEPPSSPEPPGGGGGGGGSAPPAEEQNDHPNAEDTAINQSLEGDDTGDGETLRFLPANPGLSALVAGFILCTVMNRRMQSKD
jgi:hypothetical protein